jgi:hypothetical protein
MKEGPLPKVKGKPSRLVIEALGAYEHGWCNDTLGFRVRQQHKMVLTALLPNLTEQELAHYYAGVQKLLKGTRCRKN